MPVRNLLLTPRFSLLYSLVNFPTIISMEQNRWNLAGKKAIVTGGTKGIGKAIVEEFVALGAEVLLVARNEAEVKAFTTTLRRPAGGCTAAPST
jgi:FlaA1/EpsC-like NDP-sugar epimerase